MNRQTGGTFPACLLLPQIRICGTIDIPAFDSFRAQLDDALERDGPIVLELTTFGGDADIARRMATDIGIARRQLRRDLLFLGKTFVYSSGITILAAFPRQKRYLTADAVLLVHDRKLETSFQLSGPLRASRQKLLDVLTEVEAGLKVQDEAYAALCRDSGVGLEQLREKAANNWYIDAQEALSRRLVEGLIS